ncbi:MAG: large subunit ribosomal protein [Blastocatellia bacterium]|jgi:large subunit ribosomal protein L22|nr:large subunit ribosomal protein [Blastocatellia bacterium]
MEARASAKYLRGSAQKARLVIDMIRGKNVNQALAILRYSNKRAALGIQKCVKSAIANANEAAEKANIAVDPDELWLKAAFVDRGPTKNRSRMRPAPQGRAFRERRHFCHVTILVSSDKQDGEEKATGKLKAASTPAVSKKAKRGGAAAAPRAKRVAPKTESSETKAAAPKKEAKSEKKADKAASKPGKAAGRKKTEE